MRQTSTPPLFFFGDAHHLCFGFDLDQNEKKFREICPSFFCVCAQEHPLCTSILDSDSSFFLPKFQSQREYKVDGMVEAWWT
jgi:hypothetical protein